MFDSLQQRPWVRHLKILLWKNWILAKRSRRSTCLQLSIPFIFICCLVIIQLSFERGSLSEVFVVDKNPTIETIDPIPLCIVGRSQDYCYTFIYAPANDVTKQIVDSILLNNSPVISEDSVRGFDSPEEIDAFLLDKKNHNTTQAAYLFYFDTYESLSKISNFSYVIQVNRTVQYGTLGTEVNRVQYYQLPMQLALERVLFSLIDPDLKLDVSYSMYPHTEIIAFDVIGGAGPLFFLGAIMFNLVIALIQLVFEKQTGMRESLKQMGLSDSAFWASWGVTHSIWNTTSTFVLIISGCILQLKFFLDNDFGTYFFLIWLFCMSMVPFAFLISTFLQDTRAATTVGFVIFLISAIIQIVAVVLTSTGAFENEAVRVIAGLFSPALLAKGLFDLSQFVDESGDKGLRWSDRYDYSTSDGDKDPFPLGVIYEALIGDFFLYLILALYFDNIFPNAKGVKQPKLYFLMPEYWRGRQPQSVKKDFPYTPKPDTDEDVLEAEREATKPNEENSIQIMDLCRTFGKFVAVDHLWLTLPENQLFCLLGHNGAGKTTTISMLTGLLPPTSGDALIKGLSIHTAMPQIGKFMGVCQQFDVLWNELTGRQHLTIFATVKGTPINEVETEVERRLSQVSLISAADQKTEHYSGGMRRRLSVAIAFIGNPSIVFLDEPTTGMDPISRRQVWEIIKDAKKGRTIILTTHSMEEADVLGDRIGIFGKGRLRCIGTSLHLKNKFGAGYRVVIQCSTEKLQQVQEFVLTEVPEARMGAVIGGFLSFDFPGMSTDTGMAEFFAALEQRKAELQILDIQLSLTTLEEVFLHVAHTLGQEEKDQADEQQVRNSTPDE